MENLHALFKQYCFAQKTTCVSWSQHNETYNWKQSTPTQESYIAPTQETGKISWHVVPMQEMSCKTSSLSFFAKAGIRENQSTGQVGTRLSAKISTKFVQKLRKLCCFHLCAGKPWQWSLHNLHLCAPKSVLDWLGWTHTIPGPCGIWAWISTSHQ